ncbi:hypothetical protein PUN28_020768 [Cardiocondyla obscurior]|uniref:Uncharacterized protein n=1 Tax=Cardiocondyla obscurior TaxID=286306 RepID=A0AAW2E5W2_9HYME
MYKSINITKKTTLIKFMYIHFFQRNYYLIICLTYLSMFSVCSLYVLFDEIGARVTVNSEEQGELKNVIKLINFFSVKNISNVLVFWKMLFTHSSDLCLSMTQFSLFFSCRSIFFYSSSFSLLQICCKKCFVVLIFYFFSNLLAIILTVLLHKLNPLSCKCLNFVTNSFKNSLTSAASSINSSDKTLSSSNSILYLCKWKLSRISIHLVDSASSNYVENAVAPYSILNCSYIAKILLCNIATFLKHCEMLLKYYCNIAATIKCLPLKIIVQYCKIIAMQCICNNIDTIWF